MPQKKILLIIALMFACIAWFIFDSDKNETSIAVHGKTELLLYSNLDNSFLQALISEYNNDPDRNAVIKLLLPEEREQGKLPDLYLLEHNELQLLSKQQRLYAILSEAGDLLPSVAELANGDYNQNVMITYLYNQLLSLQECACKIKCDDIMAIGDKGLICAGQDINDTLMEMLTKLVDDESELISLYYGSDLTQSEADKIAAELEALDGGWEVTVFDGGQPLYPLLLSLE